MSNLIISEYKNQIKNEIEHRNITKLLHFTTLNNAIQIIKDGAILSRRKLYELRKFAFVSDEFRMDKRIEYISTSISFPNYKMFSQKRISNPEAIWVIIQINPRIIFAKKCLFCWRNASMDHISKASDRTLTSIESFKKMFKNNVNINNKIYSREQNRLRDFETTDPQAEILVKNSIEINHIDRFIVNDLYAFKKISNFSNEVEMNRSYYFERRDSEFWRNLDESNAT